MANDSIYNVERGKTPHEYYPLDKDMMSDKKNGIPKSTSHETIRKLGKYSKNLMTSTRKLAVDVAGSYQPNAASFATSMGDVAKLAMAEARTRMEKMKEFISKNKSVDVDPKQTMDKYNKTLSDTVKDIKNRIKTGEFYRNSSDNMNMSGMFGDDFDFDSSDMDFGGLDMGVGDTGGSIQFTDPETQLSGEPFGEVNTSVGKRTISNPNAVRNATASKLSRNATVINVNDGNAGGVSAGDELVSGITGEVGKAILDQQDKLFAKNFAAAELRFNQHIEVQRGILAGINAAVDHLQNVEGTASSAAMEFQGKMLNLQQEQMALLKEIKEATILGIPESGSGRPTATIDKVMKNGQLDANEYWKAIKGNASEMLMRTPVGPLLAMMPMIGSSLGMAKDMGIEQTFDPMSMLLKFGARSALSSKTKAKMQIGDEIFQNAPALFFGKMKELSHSDSKFLQNVGRLFGVNDAVAKPLELGLKDPNKAVGWSAKSDRTLNVVIPDRLEKILTAITGREAEHYDYEKGTFVSDKRTREDYNIVKKTAYQNAFVDNTIANMAAKENASLKDFEQIRSNIGHLGETFSVERYKRDKDYRKQLARGLKDFDDKTGNSPTLDLFADAFSKLGGAESINLNGQILSQERKAVRAIQQFAEKQSIYGGAGVANDLLRQDEADKMQRQLDTSPEYQYKENDSEIYKAIVKRRKAELNRKIRDYRAGGNTSNDPSVYLTGEDAKQYSDNVAKASANGFSFDTGVGGGPVGALSGTVNNIFNLLAKGILVYPQMSDGIPEHVSALQGVLKSRVDAAGLAAKSSTEDSEKAQDEVIKAAAEWTQQQRNMKMAQMFGMWPIITGFAGGGKTSNKFDQVISSGYDKLFGKFGAAMGGNGSTLEGDVESSYNEYVGSHVDTIVKDLQKKCDTLAPEIKKLESKKKLTATEKLTLRAKKAEFATYVKLLRIHKNSWNGNGVVNEAKSTAAKYATKAEDAFKAGFSTVANSKLGQTITGAASTVANSKFGQTVADAASTAGEALASGFETVASTKAGQAIKTGVDYAATSVKDTAKKLSETEAAKKTADILSKTKDKIKARFPSGDENITKEEVEAIVMETVVETEDVPPEKASEIAKKLISSVDFGKLKNKAGSIASAIGVAASTLWASTSDKFSNFAKKFSEQGAKATATEYATKAKDSAQAAYGTASDFVNDKWSEFVKAGQSSPVMDKLKEAFGFVSDKASGLFTGVKNAASVGVTFVKDGALAAGKKALFNSKHIGGIAAYNEAENLKQGLIDKFFATKEFRSKEDIQEEYNTFMNAYNVADELKKNAEVYFDELVAGSDDAKVRDSAIKKVNKYISKELDKLVTEEKLDKAIAGKIKEGIVWGEANGLPGTMALGKVLKTLRERYDKNYSKEMRNYNPAIKVAKSLGKWTGTIAGGAVLFASGNPLLGAALVGNSLRTNPIVQKLAKAHTDKASVKNRLKASLNGKAVGKYGANISLFDSLLGITPMSKMSDKELENEQRIAASTFKALDELENWANANVDPASEDAADQIIAAITGAMKKGAIDSDIGEIVIDRIKTNVKKGRTAVEALTEAKATIQKNYSKMFKGEQRRRSPASKILKGLGKGVGIATIAMYNPMLGAALIAREFFKKKQAKKASEAADERDEINEIRGTNSIKEKMPKAKREKGPGLFSRLRDRFVSRGVAGEATAEGTSSEQMAENGNGFFSGLKGKASTVVTGVTSGSYLNQMKDKLTKVREERETENHDFFEKMSDTLTSIKHGLGVHDKGDIDEKDEETFAGKMEQILGATTAVGTLQAQSNAANGMDVSKLGKFLKSAGGAAPKVATGIAAAGVAINVAAVGYQAVKGVKRWKNEGAAAGIGQLTGIDKSADSKFNEDGTRKEANFHVGGENGFDVNVGDGAERAPAKRALLNVGTHVKAIQKAGKGVGEFLTKKGDKLLAKGGKAAAGVADSVPPKIISKVTEALSKFFSKGKVAKLISPEKAKGVISKITDRFKNSSLLKKASAKVGGKQIPVIGLVASIAGAVWDFVNGMSKTRRYFKIGKDDEPTMGMKIAAGLAESLPGLVGAIPGIGLFAGILAAMIPPEWVAENVYKIFAGEKEEAALAEKQENFRKKAEELGIDPDRLNEYENKSLGQKITGAFKSQDKKDAADAKLLGFGDDVEAYREWKKKYDAHGKSDKAAEAQATVIDKGEEMENSITGTVSAATAAAMVESSKIQPAASDKPEASSSKSPEGEAAQRTLNGMTEAEKQNASSVLETAAVAGAGVAGGVAAKKAVSDKLGETPANPVKVKESPFVTNDKLLVQQISETLAVQKEIRDEMFRHNGEVEKFIAYMVNYYDKQQKRQKKEAKEAREEKNSSFFKNLFGRDKDTSSGIEYVDHHVNFGDDAAIVSAAEAVASGAM